MGSISISREPRSLGPAGVRVFPIAYGCWRWTATERRIARVRVEAAVESGIELFDLADVYGGPGVAEELFGQVLRETPSLRSRILVSTKCGVVPGVPYDASYTHVTRAAEASLQRLHCEVIDLFWIHRYDALTHPEETARALRDLQERARIRAVGVSNYQPSQLRALQRFLPIPITAYQREWNCVWQAPLLDGTIDHCLEDGLGFVAWSPLAGGKLLLSKEDALRETNAEPLGRVIERLDGIAAAWEVSRAAVAVAFLLAHPVGAVPIIGTRRPERIRKLCEEVFRVELARSEWYGLLQAGLGKLP